MDEKRFGGFEGSKVAEIHRSGSGIGREEQIDDVQDEERASVDNQRNHATGGIERYIDLRRA